MVSEHARLEAVRRDIATSTDPIWMRQQHGVDSAPSKMFAIVAVWMGAVVFLVAYFILANL
jgi:hypothetical protein